MSPTRASAILQSTNELNLTFSAGINLNFGLKSFVETLKAMNSQAIEQAQIHSKIFFFIEIWIKLTDKQKINDNFRKINMILNSVLFYNVRINTILKIILNQIYKFIRLLIN